MKNKNYQVHKIVFVSILITAMLDMNGYLRTSDSFFFIFISLLFLLYGLEKLGFFLSIFEGIKHMIKFLSNKIKNITARIKNFFLKKKTKTIKKSDSLSKKSKKKA